jgi:hypothetical protein
MRLAFATAYDRRDIRRGWRTFHSLKQEPRPGRALVICYGIISEGSHSRRTKLNIHESPSSSRNVPRCGIMLLVSEESRA